MFVVRTLVLDRIRTKVLTTNHFYDSYMTGHDIKGVSTIFQRNRVFCVSPISPGLQIPMRKFFSLIPHITRGNMAIPNNSIFIRHQPF
jgi:hypothetical protein